MKIKFSEMLPQHFEHFKDGNKGIDAIMQYDGKNRIMLGKLEPGASIGLHKHEGSAEIMYILEGNPTIITNGVSERYQSGECHYCPEGSEHTLINESDEVVRFFAVVPQY